MKRMIVYMALGLTTLMCAFGCAAGYRFKAGVDVSLTSIVSDSTRTTSITKSSSERYVERDTVAKR